MNNFLTQCYIYPNTRTEPVQEPAGAEPIPETIIEILDGNIIHPDTGTHNEPYFQITYRIKGEVETHSIILSKKNVFDYQRIIRSEIKNIKPVIWDKFIL